MIDSSKRPGCYNLGWHRGDVATAGNYLVYVLIPDGLGVFRGMMDFERISGGGLSMPTVSAGPGDLASPRRPGDPEGIPLLIEQRLIRQLQMRASRAGIVLPEIVPSTRDRGWSQMPLDDKQRRRLLRAGGVE